MSNVAKLFKKTKPISPLIYSALLYSRPYYSRLSGRMASSSSLFRVRNNRLEIHDLSTVYDIINHFETNPDCERQVTAIDIGNDLGAPESDGDKVNNTPSL